jgi:peroxiredoxin
MGKRTAGAMLDELLRETDPAKRESLRQDLETQSSKQLGGAKVTITSPSAVPMTCVLVRRPTISKLETIMEKEGTDNVQVLPSGDVIVKRPC